MSVLVSFLLTLRTAARSRAELQLEVLALRQQLLVLQRTRSRRVRLAKTDRWLWVVRARFWTGWPLLPWMTRTRAPKCRLSVQNV